MAKKESKRQEKKKARSFHNRPRYSGARRSGEVPERRSPLAGPRPRDPFATNLWR